MFFAYFRENLIYRVIAVLLAVGIWFFVLERQNPIQERVLNVPLETRELAEDYVVSDKPNSVDVRVEGRKGALEELTPREIEAYVNLEEAVKGSNILPVKVELPQNIKLVSVVPEQVEVEIDEITSRQFTLDINVRGSPQEGYQAGSPQVKPDQVNIFGPERMLDRVAKAYVEVDISGAASDFKKDINVSLRDTDGKDISHEWISTSPEYVEVFVPIVPESPLRTVPVIYEIVGEPAEGFEIKNISIYPEVIEIAAESRDLLFQTNYIIVEIPVEGSSESIDTMYSFSVPQGIETIDRDEARVVVEIGPVEEETEAEEED